MLGANARLRKNQKLLYLASIYISVRQNPTIASGTYFGLTTQGPRTRITHIVFYFDYLVASGFRERIDYKFLEAGHSFGAVDRDGGLAEGLFRNAEHLETPMDFSDN